MPGTITALRFQKHSGDWVNVYLDGKFGFGLPALAAAQLHVGQHLSEADIERLRSTSGEQKAYERAVRLLAVRPRSQAEIRRCLAQAAIPDAVSDAVVRRLTEQGYLNDADFARYWVENRTQFRPKGARALRQELRQKGLEGPAIQSALDGLEQADMAYEAARPRALRLAALRLSDPVAFQHKLGDFLLRRGFDYETMRETVARLAREIGQEEPDGIPPANDD